MYLSITQIERSARRLSGVHPFIGISFFVFCKYQIPIGRTVRFAFTRAAKEIMDNFFKPLRNKSEYYSPFSSSKHGQGGHWVSPRYPSTSLQRITSDTFASAFIHPPGSSEWGWDENFLRIIAEKNNALGMDKPSLFDLAVWYSRASFLEDTVSPANVIDKFLANFHASQFELSDLFDLRVDVNAQDWLSVSETNTLDFLAALDDLPALGLSVSVPAELSIVSAGPVNEINYMPNSRLNVVTGDNSLGKTFLLETLWWALTKTWPGHTIFPKETIGAKNPEIRFGYTSSFGNSVSSSHKFNWRLAEWEVGREAATYPGLAIFSGHDGTFSVWNPARETRSGLRSNNESLLRFSVSEIWDGKVVEVGSKTSHVCNGLLEDLVSWQLDPDSAEVFEVFEKVLVAMAPPGSEKIKIGKPTNIISDSRKIPTLILNHGAIPLVFASAGIKRMLALAYILVWSWMDYQKFTGSRDIKLGSRLVLIIDELEAHLHPKWQRQVIGSILRAVKSIEDELEVQLHVATHSPLVLAAMEPFFEPDLDGLFLLESEREDITLTRLEFLKCGTVERWLESQSFGLKHARSLEAERVIESAKDLQKSANVTVDAVERVHADLLRILPDDDEFWVRWSYFADKVRGEQ